MIPDDGQKQGDTGNGHGLEALTQHDEGDICSPVIFASIQSYVVDPDALTEAFLVKTPPSCLNLPVSIARSETGLGYLYTKCDEE